MTIETLQSRARPEALLRICDVIKNETITLDELNDRLPLSQEDIQQNVEYGSSLGFLNTDDEIELTERGLTLAYEDGISNSVGSLFVRGIRDSDQYSELSQELTEETDENGAIDQQKVCQVLRVEFGVEMDENELKSAVNSYFLTLEAASVGEYKLARGGSPSRIELREGIRLADITEDGIEALSEAEEAERLASDEFPAFSDYDPELETRCIPQFKLGLYQEAVTSATTVLEHRVRTEGGYSEEDHGETLMAKAFSENEGPLQMGVVENEMEGFRFLYQGTSKALRNPPHHRLLDDMDQQQARDILGFINLLLTFIENRD
jgi:uncharacterized protein (TIGR02391 family)